MKNNHPLTRCLLAAGVLILFTGCHPLTPSGQIEARPDAAAIYAQACAAMAMAKNTEEFAAAMSSLDGIAGLDITKADPQGLVTALRHGITLMKAADLKAGAGARKSQARETQLRQKIQVLEKHVKTLRHQITVLENIDQERQEKRKTQ